MSESRPAFRRTRVLLALGPIAGTLGAFLGVAAGLHDPAYIAGLPFDDLCGLGFAFYSLAALITLGVAGHGWAREKPFHALKACGALAVAHVFPGLLMAKVIEGIGC